MKIKIRYNYDPSFPQNPFWAIANDVAYACSAESFQDAKRKLLKDFVGKPEGLEIPPEEEVEI